MSVTDKLDYLENTKIAIAEAIEEQGIEVSEDATFRSYATLISQIEGSGTGGVSPTIEVLTESETEYVLTITDANGSYNTPNLQGQDGNAGVYVGEDDPSEEYLIWIDTKGNSTQYIESISVNGESFFPNDAGEAELTQIASQDYVDESISSAIALAIMESWAMEY